MIRRENCAKQVVLRFVEEEARSRGLLKKRNMGKILQQEEINMLQAATFYNRRRSCSSTSTTRTRCSVTHLLLLCSHLIGSCFVGSCFAVSQVFPPLGSEMSSIMGTSLLQDEGEEDKDVDIKTII